MQITVYKNFKKKENSTKRPSGGTNVTVHLKNDTSFLTPSFLMESPDLTINYCKWNNRYYFVTDIVLISNQLYEIMCQVDVLATYKDEIGASTQYVLRSAADSDGSVVDTLYPCKTGVSFSNNTITNPFANGVGSGKYIVGVVGYSANAIGAVTYYVLDIDTFNSLVQKMLTYDPERPETAVYQAIEDVGINLWKSIFNPIQYIVSCIFIPYADIPTGSSTSIHFGWWDSGITAAKLSTTPTKPITSLTIAVPKHPQAETRGSYLNTEPYSRYALDFKPFGYIPLDSGVLADCESLYLHVTLDCMTGDAILSIAKNSLSNSFRDVIAKVGIPIQLAQISQNALNGLTTAAKAGTEAVASYAAGGIAGAIISGVTGIASAAQAFMPQMETTGGNGSFLELQYAIWLKAQFLEVVDENNEHRGRPLCKDKVISTVPGYNVVLDAKLDIAGTASEKSAVKSFMESGFFYE